MVRAAQLDDRKAAILKAIVQDFILDGQPVASKRLVEELDLNVSAATVRADMAELESAGFIRQPHTSAGRIPTDAGYRYFVDQLSRTPSLAPSERLALEQLLLDATDVEDLLQRASTVLSRLTRLTSLVTAPRLDRSRLRHVELVRLGSTTVLAVFIADTGRVEKRILDLESPMAEHDVHRVRQVVNEVAAGFRLVDAHDVVAGLAAGAPAELRTLFEKLGEALGSGVSTALPGADRVFVGGAAHLALRATDETLERLADVYEMLEEHVVLLGMLREALKTSDPAVRIGRELPLVQLAPFSVVASTYEATGDAVGSLGLLGPTRMDYPQAVATVRAVAVSLQRALASLTGEMDD